MTDPIDNLDPPAAFEQPIWKPRHRVDPMRPPNPHTADPELESFYEEKLREGRTGANLSTGLVIAVLALFSAAVMVWLVALNVGFH